MRLTLLYILPVFLFASMAFAQKRDDCNDYYLGVASDFHSKGDLNSALSNYFKQRKYYPECPESAIALFKTIEIYHDRILESGDRDLMDAARSLVIEFSSLSDDSAMIADVKSLWADIEKKESEITLTATVFWEIVGSVGLLVLYFTIDGL